TNRSGRAQAHRKALPLLELAIVFLEALHLAAPPTEFGAQRLDAGDVIEIGSRSAHAAPPHRDLLVRRPGHLPLRTGIARTLHEDIDRLPGRHAPGAADDLPLAGGIDQAITPIRSCKGRSVAGTVKMTSRFVLVALPSLRAVVPEHRLALLVRLSGVVRRIGAPHFGALLLRHRESHARARPRRFGDILG